MRACSEAGRNGELRWTDRRSGQLPRPSRRSVIHGLSQLR